MTPSNWLSFSFFAYLLLPGLYLDRLSKRRRQSPSESTLAELGRIVLGSMVFSAIGFLFIALGRWLIPTLLPDPGKLLIAGNYFDTHYQKVLWTLLFEELIALFAVWIFDQSEIIRQTDFYVPDDIIDILFWGRSNKKNGLLTRRTQQFLVWIFKIKGPDIQPKEHEPNIPAYSPRTLRVAKVYLNSGEAVVGFPLWSAGDGHEIEREITLEPVAYWNIPFLQEEIRELADRDKNSENIYIPIQSIKMIQIYPVHFERPAN